MRTTTTTTRGEARAALATLAALTLLAVAACGPVNRGSDLADQAEAALRDAPGVAEVVGSGQNPLPWTGSAAADVRLDPGATREDALAVVARATGLMRDAGGDLEVRLAQDVDGTDVVLTLDPDRDPAEQLDRRDAVAALVAGGSLTIRPDGVPVDTGSSASTAVGTTVAADVADAAQAAALVTGLGGAVADWADADVTATLPDGRTITARPASSPAAALLGDLAHAGVPVRSGSVNRTAAWLRVDPGALDAAREVADARPDLRVTVAAADAPTPAPSTTP
ncbi:hypothetical protein [Cellulomonas sp.]|uniref:hypothetical protein n=1 Tax=Cellulomonas sp. TaxID=40001 RepID=UPI002D6EDE33|nr:hypothetical protein [Cellulomonas sp.]HYQ74108.1 hypothetical protein [Cellulomonas sp.]